MIFITGGAYQGKLEYAKEIFNLKDDEIYTCTKNSMPDFSYRCIYHIENYVYYCIKNQIEPIFPESEIIIGRDISSGIVPIDPLIRLFREEYGRYCQKLAKKSERVIRLFCGIAQFLK